STVTEHECSDDQISSGLLWQQRKLEPAWRGRALRPCFDISGTGVKRFTSRDSRFAFVVLQHRSRVHLGGNFSTNGGSSREEHAQCPIRGKEIFCRHTLNVFRSHTAKTITIQEEQPPVACGDPLAEFKTKLARIAER